MQMGDIVAFSGGEESGHVTLYIGKNAQGQDELIYAGRWKVVKKPLKYVAEELEEPFIIRRYTP